MREIDPELPADDDNLLADDIDIKKEMDQMADPLEQTPREPLNKQPDEDNMPESYRPFVQTCETATQTMSVTTVQVATLTD